MQLAESDLGVQLSEVPPPNFPLRLKCYPSTRPTFLDLRVRPLAEALVGGTWKSMSTWGLLMATLGACIGSPI